LSPLSCKRHTPSARMMNEHNKRHTKEFGQHWTLLQFF
jgi:hypothetical protein